MKKLLFLLLFIPFLCQAQTQPVTPAFRGKITSPNQFDSLLVKYTNLNGYIALYPAAYLNRYFARLGTIGTGTVTNVSGVNANGFTWSIANPSSTPAITLTQTQINGITTSYFDPTSSIQTQLNAKQAALGFTPANQATTLTINGVTYDLSTNRSWSISAGVTSVFGRSGAVVAAANDYTFSQIASTPITLLGYGITDAYPLSGNPSNFLTASSTNTLSNKDFTGAGNTFPTFNQATTSNAGSATKLATPRNIQGVAFDGTANIDPINGTGFVKATGTTLSYDNSTYLAGNAVSGSCSNCNLTYVNGQITVAANGSPGGLTTSNFVYNETPSGTINGVNVTFTLANTPTTGTVRIYKNGLRLTPTTDYTLSSGTITFTSAPSSTGYTDVLIADYLK